VPAEKLKRLPAVDGLAAKSPYDRGPQVSRRLIARPSSLQNAAPVTSKPIPRWLGVVLMLGIATTFGSNHVAARIAFDHGANVTTAVAFRSVGTALAVLALLLANGVPLKLSAATRGRAMVIGCALAVQSVCIYSAVARIPVALALLVFNTFPLILSLLSWAAGAERPTRRMLAMMPVALAGLALALDAGGWSGRNAAGFAGRWAEIGAGVVLALGAAMAFAAALFLTTRWLADVDGRMRSFMTMGTVGVLAVVAGFSTGSFVLPRDATGWMGIAALTVLYCISITSLFVLLPRLGAVNNAALMNFEPIAVLFLAWAILDQAVAPLQIAGAAVVIGAIVAMATGKR
jgi:drug/metabolite transporter (DMT)-like permease